MITKDSNPLKCPIPFMPLRKLVHMGGTVFVFIAYFFGKHEAIYLVLLCMSFFLLLELLKPGLCNNAYLRCLWREEEVKGFALDPLLYFLSILCLLLFSLYLDEGICYASIAVLTMGDGISTIVGVRGKHHFRDSKKTIEGAVSGILASFVVGFFFAGYFALIGSLAGMFAEVTSRRYDNLTVPFSAFFMMMFARFLVG